MSQTTFRLVAATDVGLVRTNNEDNFIVNPDLSQSDEWYVPTDTRQALDLGPQGALLVVADGMGGQNAGEVASAIAIETIQRTFVEADLEATGAESGGPERLMRHAIDAADRAIKKRVETDPATSGMGTTVIMVWAIGGKAHLAWCGDSRAYLFNPASGLTRISKDHSYVQQLVDEGHLDEELAFDHPDSNIITRCLGDFPDRAKPDYKAYDLRADDIILLCSDGLCGYCRDAEIMDVMANHADDLAELNRQLIRHALDAGGYDNVTIAMMQVVSAEPAAAAAPVQATNDATVTPTSRWVKGVLALLALIAAIGAIVYVRLH